MEVLQSTSCWMVLNGKDGFVLVRVYQPLTMVFHYHETVLQQNGPLLEHCLLGDSKWPFYPLVGGHLAIPKRAQRITWPRPFLFLEKKLGSGFKHFFFHPYLGRWSNLTSIFFKWVGSTTNQKRSTIQLPRVYEKSVRAFLFEQSDVPWAVVTNQLEMLFGAGEVRCWGWSSHL